MKVKELLIQLSQLNPELEVICYSEDSELLPSKHGFRLLDIDTIDSIDAERVRGDDQVLSLKIGKSPTSEKFAIIQVTSDF